MDMNGTLAIEPKRCCLCHRILLSEVVPSGVVEVEPMAMSICGDCKFLFVEQEQHTTPTTRYINTPESIENILSQEFPDMINLSRHMQPIASNHGYQSGSWRRVLSDTESDGFDSVFEEADIFPYANSNSGSYDHDDDDDDDDDDGDDDDGENTHESLLGRARLHRSLATNGRNVDWLTEVLSPEAGIGIGIGISERRGIDGNLEEQVAWRNVGEYLDGEIDRGAPPASASFVKNLERVVVDDVEGLGLVCVICKESVCVGSVVNRLPCLHVYHPSCIMPWLNAHNTCPLCRYELPTDSEKRRPNRSHALLGESENVSGGGGGGWWFVVAPLVSVVGIGLMLWLGGGGSEMDNRSRRWWSLL